MSDENVPKLRLKPKLAGESPEANQAPAEPAPPIPQSPPAVPEVPPTPPGEARPSRLRPRITIEPPAQEASGTAAAGPAESEVPAPAETASADSAASKLKISLKPRSEGASTAPAAEPLPATLNAPPPTMGAARAGAAPAFPPPTGRAMGEPAQAAVNPAAPAVPFPAPTAKFPPPAGTRKPDAAAAQKPAEGARKSFLVVGGAVAIIVLLGGGFFVFRRHAANPQPSPARVAGKPAATSPLGPGAVVQQTLEKAEKEQLAPLNEVIDSDQHKASPAKANPAVVETKANAEPAAVVPPPPPPPPPLPVASPAFKAWVENLHILGLRSGQNPRVFIEHTAYRPGDLVNPELGISFAGYNSETHMMLFKDKTGATVERRE